MYVTLYTAVPNVSHLHIIFPTNNIQYVYHTITRSTKCQPLKHNISNKLYTVCMSHYIPQYKMSATYRIYFTQTIYSMYITLYTAVPNVSHLQNIFPTTNIQYVCHTVYRSTKCQPLTEYISHKQYTVCMSHYIPQYQMSAT